jgi:hypothetical protein
MVDSVHATTIYILYNAKASALGKVAYVCRKFTAPADGSACAACDLTHRGTHFNETAEWKATKAKITANFKQLHIDELNDEVMIDPGDTF